MTAEFAKDYEQDDIAAVLVSNSMKFTQKIEKGKRARASTTHNKQRSQRAFGLLLIGPYEYRTTYGTHG